MTKKYRDNRELESLPQSHGFDDEIRTDPASAAREMTAGSAGYTPGHIRGKKHKNLVDLLGLKLELKFFSPNYV